MIVLKHKDQCMFAILKKNFAEKVMISFLKFSNVDAYFGQLSLCQGTLCCNYQAAKDLDCVVEVVELSLIHEHSLHCLDNILTWPYRLSPTQSVKCKSCVTYIISTSYSAKIISYAICLRSNALQNKRLSFDCSLTVRVFHYLPQAATFLIQSCI